MVNFSFNLFSKKKSGKNEPLEDGEEDFPEEEDEAQAGEDEPGFDDRRDPDSIDRRKGDKKKPPFWLSQNGILLIVTATFLVGTTLGIVVGKLNKPPPREEVYLLPSQTEVIDAPSRRATPQPALPKIRSKPSAGQILEKMEKDGFTLSEPDGEPPVFSTEYGEVFLPEPGMKAGVSGPEPLAESEKKEADKESAGEEENPLHIALGKPDKLAWIRNAVVPPKTGKRPMITIVVDDLGLSLARSERVFALKPPLTLAFLPYADNLAQQSRQALEDGHELLLHLPMEPENGDFDPGPRALMTDFDRKKIVNDLQWNLARFSSYVGINNHMGSRFTTDRKGMKTVMREVKKRGLLYLDSLTTNASVGPGLAREMGVPYAVRHVFLDNVISYNAIRDRLKDLEKVALEQGFAIGICHPHDATIQALSSWLKTLDGKGLVLVPLSSIVLKRMEIRDAATKAKLKG